MRYLATLKENAIPLQGGIFQEAINSCIVEVKEDDPKMGRMLSVGKHHNTVTFGMLRYDYMNTIKDHYNLIEAVSCPSHPWVHYAVDSYCDECYMEEVSRI
jgi:hypothetical protein